MPVTLVCVQVYETGLGPFQTWNNATKRIHELYTRDGPDLRYLPYPARQISAGFCFVKVAQIAGKRAILLRSGPILL